MLHGFSCSLAVVIAVVVFSNENGDKGVVLLNAKLAVYEDLIEHGVEEVLQREYGSYLVKPEVFSLSKDYIFLIF